MVTMKKITIEYKQKEMTRDSKCIAMKNHLITKKDIKEGNKDKNQVVRHTENK